jgi:predicted nucleic acid-binding protein
MGGLYWDACVLIYRIQRVDPWNRRIADALAASSEPKLVVSELGRMECRVKPLREGDQTTLAKYDKFFAAPTLGWVPYDRPIFDLAANLRARHALKTPDALHLAAAIVGGCGELWTNDRRLEEAAEGRLRVVSVDELP